MTVECALGPYTSPGLQGLGGLQVVQRVDRCEPVRFGGDVAFPEEIQLRVGVDVAGTGGSGAADAVGSDPASGEEGCRGAGVSVVTCTCSST